ncbi:MAG: hypothetical protein JHC87_08690 [Thermoleophilaceae bacterium]|nr:hypothetical protein [Thermoleophilaceae bacterium]
MPDTPRAGLRRPEDADPFNIAADQRQNVDILDKAAFDSQGTFALRPLATAVKSGTYFFATDTGVTYRSDGTVWSVVGKRTVGGIVDTELASSNNAVFKTILQASAKGSSIGMSSTGVWGLAETGDASASPADRALPMLYFAAADYTVAGLTTKLRVNAQVLANATAIATTLTFGLHAVTASAGVSGGLSTTLNGTPVSGSTVAFVSPSASSRNQAQSSVFTVPADGYYTLAVINTAGFAGNAAVQMSAQLQVVHI